MLDKTFHFSIFNMIFTFHFTVRRIRLKVLTFKYKFIKLILTKNTLCNLLNFIIF